MRPNLVTTRLGGLTKQQASFYFSEGKKIRVRTPDGSRWRIVDLKKTREETLHDAMIAAGLKPFGINNSARIPYAFFLEE